MTRASSRPLDDDDIVELAELLAAIPEERDALDVAMLDGFLVGVLLQPDLVLPTAWLPYVFDAQGGEVALPDAVDAIRAGDLIMRRYNELAACVVAREPFDPIVFELEDEAGRAIGGKAGIAALEPWAVGFASALDAFPGLAAAHQRDDELAAALTGVLRHLPASEQADPTERAEYEAHRNELDARAPLVDLDDAIDELVACVFEAAEITRPNRPVTRDTPKVGRNDPCPCGSGRKYKMCHGRDAPGAT
jgi:uncharacterized protein